MTMNTVEKMRQALNPELVERFKTAVALGKWPNGQALTDQQRSTCIQAIIAFEQKHLPPEQRTGFIEPRPTPCAHEREEPLSWND